MQHGSWEQTFAKVFVGTLHVWRDLSPGYRTRAALEERASVMHPGTRHTNEPLAKPRGRFDETERVSYNPAQHKVSAWQNPYYCMLEHTALMPVAASPAATTSDLKT